MSEEWKDIEGYEGLYQISNCGRVKSTQYYHGTYERILKQSADKDGYLIVRLYKNGKGKMHSLHRLVAETFLDNPDNLSEVNHINEDKTDNMVDNLEWCAHNYNVKHGTCQQRRADKLSNVVCQYTIDGDFIREWPSAHEIERQLGFNNGNINRCCRGKQKIAYGYKWRYRQ